jgi:hypothetical protein
MKKLFFSLTFSGEVLSSGNDSHGTDIALTAADLKSNLDRLVEIALAESLITGNTAATLESQKVTVEVAGSQLNVCSKDVVLDYGISISANGGGGSISSRLQEQFVLDGEEGNVYAKGASDALESFLLAMASEGVALAEVAMKNALKTAVEAIGNNAENASNNVKEPPYRDVAAMFVPVNRETFETIKKQFDAFTRCDVTDEIMVDLSPYDKSELIEMGFFNLPSVDSDYLYREANYVLFYVDA